MNNFLSFDKAKDLAKSYISTENWSKAKVSTKAQVSTVDSKFLTFEEVKVATQKINLKGKLEWENYHNSGLKS